MELVPPGNTSGKVLKLARSQWDYSIKHVILQIRCVLEKCQKAFESQEIISVTLRNNCDTYHWNATTSAMEYKHAQWHYTQQFCKQEKKNNVSS